MNESGHKLFGYKNGQLIGKNWFDTCLPEEIRTDVRKMFLQIINGDLDNVRTFQNQVLTASGDKRDILWHNTFIYDPKGNIESVLCSGEDITAIIQAEEGSFPAVLFFRDSR